MLVEVIVYEWPLGCSLADGIFDQLLELVIATDILFKN